MPLPILRFVGEIQSQDCETAIVRLPLYGWWSRDFDEADGKPSSDIQGPRSRPPAAAMRITTSPRHHSHSLRTYHRRA